MFRLLIGCTMLGAIGCAPELAVVPRGGMDRAVAQVNGVTLVAFANQWDAYPYDLADYVTPIAVELYNPGPNEVRVSYADLALRDGSGFRYAAINPYIPATTVGQTEVRGERHAHAALLTENNGLVLLAANGGGVLVAQGRYGGGMRSAPPAGGGFRSAPPAGGGFRSSPAPMYRGGGSMYRSPPPAHFGGYGTRTIIPPPRGGMIGAPGGRHYGWGYPGGGWNGYLVSGGLRGYYGVGVGYWGGPWFYPPYYSDWVFGWGPGYYPQQPSTDVLSLGLPEGVLPPGARVSGFLYFKRATAAHQGALELSWDVHDARTGAALGVVKVPLEVVQR
jgi:hypothetical protein